MKIPKKVKIGGITYKIIIANDWLGKGEDTQGQNFQDSQKGNVIYIDSGLSQEAQFTTFLHECLHSMNATMNHEFLESLSLQLYQFLKDNSLLKE